VDTGGFYAILVRADPMHARALEILANAARLRKRFVTTDYILDETTTLLKARKLGHLVPGLFEHVFTSRSCRVEWMNPERFQHARQFVLKHQDQDWSFTDCFSFIIMKELGLRDTLGTDMHFRHAGFNPLLV
jgi:uncharacterized protein